jgi:hypothetical protein
VETKVISRVAIVGSSQGLPLTFLGHDPEISEGDASAFHKTAVSDRETNRPLNLSRQPWRNNRPVGQHDDQLFHRTGNRELFAASSCDGRISTDNLIPEKLRNESRCRIFETATMIAATVTNNRIKAIVQVGAALPRRLDARSIVVRIHLCGYATNGIR